MNKDEEISSAMNEIVRGAFFGALSLAEQISVLSALKQHYVSEFYSVRPVDEE